METPWGDIRVCDAHVHFFSHSFVEALDRQRPESERQSVKEAAETLEWTAPPADNSKLAKRWADELDRHGVSRAALIASVPGDEDAVGEAVRACPDRFFGYFMLDPLASDAVARARRAFDELSLKGVCLFPAMHRFSVQDERLAPIYELAAERPGTIVFVHMGVLTVGVRKRMSLPSRFDMSKSNPIDLHRVALEHPKANFVIPHFGAGYFREVLMLGDLAPNVHLDTSSSNSWLKYLVPDVTLAGAYIRALEVYGHERLLFGTDSSFFPRGWNRMVFDAQVAALEQDVIDATAARAVFGGNLLRLMGAAEAQD